MGFRFKESDVLSSCLQYLRLSGIFAWRSNNTGVFDPARKCFRSFRGLKGVSDLLGVLADGRLLAVETKRAGNRPTAEQQAFLDEVNRRGGVGLWVTSVHELAAALEPVLRAL
jgi:VRR-NUC domain